MSQEPLHVARLSEDAIQDRTVIDSEQGSATARHSSRRPPLRTRPQPWHPYGPVEPPMESSSSRSIGVHSILNPPAQPEDQADSSREKHSGPAPSSPRPRKGSSPAPRAMHPLVQQPLSPRARGHSMVNPGSPSARFVGSGGRSGRSSVSHSPLVPHEPPLGIRQTPASSPMSLDSTLRPITSLPGTQPPVSASLHSTPSVQSRQASTGLGPLTTPVSQEPSPTTPHSSYTFGRGSPAAPNVSMAPAPPVYAVPSGPSVPYMTMESLNRGIPAASGPRMSEITAVPSRGQGIPLSPEAPGMIPCFVDLKSGSSSQAEKRKANSDASRRFRNRKRNEMQLEARLTAQQDEIRALLQQRDHYRSERDFFREQLSRSVPLSQLPPRPSSPRAAPSTLVLGSPSDTPSAPVWSGSEIARGTQTPATPSAQRGLEPARPQSGWPGSSLSRDIAPSGPSVAGGPLPPFQGSTWSRQ
ncbi:hypothetical protein N7468_006507 [Penicillium chermesinum]|uniref:BZIP domain-containing protein n=1 Tax=Penicillium chermesinum TaxID=63820 RepID=A0A9W9NSD2_9EURO|nr:uncharacterized protein N7468_006507 [Penicillium chermesinum]KAJ5225282.1 hypothetical protein N7468_006507 [Penicillium chermesinum]